ncbi:MAG TPA: protein tyrosine phosphatase family protein [Candidatus Acidoferrales bacterium]
MKRRAMFLAALFAATALVAQQSAAPQLPETTSVRNYLRVNETICTGGQPTTEELAMLKAGGVRSILNLRRPSEYNHAEEEKKAKELGLRYFNIPVSSADPKPEQVDEFLKVMRDPAVRPAFIHCGSANRVGAFWMIYRVVEDGAPAAEAEAEARKIGLRDGPARDFALKYIADRAANKKKASGPPCC